MQKKLTELVREIQKEAKKNPDSQELRNASTSLNTGLWWLDKYNKMPKAKPKVEKTIEETVKVTIGDISKTTTKKTTTNKK